MQIDELMYAENAITKMEASLNMDDYEMHWKAFLHYLVRSWNKFQDLAKTNDVPQQLVSKVNQARKNDPLIQYLAHARNSDEHSIRQIVERKTGGTTVTAGTGGATIHRGVIQGNGIVSNLVYEGNLKIEFSPGYIEIIAVTDSGQLYQPPVEHLSKPITTRIPHEIARLGLTYYRSELDNH